MRKVTRDKNRLQVTDDPQRVLGDFLEYAMSLGQIFSRPLMEEIAQRFAPDGQGLSLPDLLAAYGITDPEDLPPPFGPETLAEGHITEPWVITLLRPRSPGDSVVLDGGELRDLLRQALSLRHGC